MVRINELSETEKRECKDSFLYAKRFEKRQYVLATVERDPCGEYLNDSFLPDINIWRFCLSCFSHELK